MFNRESVKAFAARSVYGRWVQANRRVLFPEGCQHSLEEHCEKQMCRLGLLLAGSALGAVAIREKAVLILLAGLLYVFREDVRNHQNARKTLAAYRREFPRLVSNYIVFLEAGYPVETALRRAAEMGADNDIKAALRQAFRDIDHGTPRNEALGRIVRRIREPNLSKLVFLTLQGISLGEGQMARSLELLAQNCWKSRMDEMRIRSERASAKMVFPMMLIFVGISLLTLTPGLIALLQIR